MRRAHRCADRWSTGSVELEYGTDLRTADARRFAQRLVHQPGKACSFERVFTELGDAGLLFGVPFEFDLRELAVRYVGDDAVPARASLRISHQRRFVTHPHRPAVTMQHAVFVGGCGLDELLLAPKHTAAVVRV